MLPPDAALPAWWAAEAESLSSSRSIESAVRQHLDAPAIAADLCRCGFTVIDKFLGSRAATAQVLDGIQRLDNAGHLRLGKIQQGTQQNANTQSRTDRIAFLPSIQQQQKAEAAKAGSHVSNGGGGGGSSSSGGGGAVAAASTTVTADACSDALRAYTRAVDVMREALSAQARLVDRVGGSLDDCNLMCACYPGGGARYVKHRDALPYKAGRKLTVIYYLNAHWQPGHGGELRIWPSDEPETEHPAVIAPLADRLVVFISSLEHEVRDACPAPPARACPSSIACARAPSRPRAPAPARGGALRRHLTRSWPCAGAAGVAAAVRADDVDVQQEGHGARGACGGDAPAQGEGHLQHSGAARRPR